jgi:hypothetical protein
MYSGKGQEDSEDESDEDEDEEVNIDSILDTLKNVDIKENGTEEDITGMPRKIY